MVLGFFITRFFRIALLQHFLNPLLHFRNAFGLLSFVVDCVALIKTWLSFSVNTFLALTLITLLDPFCMMPPCILNASFHIYSVVVGTFGNSFLEIGIGLVITSRLRIAHLQHFCYQFVNFLVAFVLIFYHCECAAVIVLWLELSVNAFLAIFDIAISDPLI
jgi:hypothetical protein